MKTPFSEPCVTRTIQSFHFSSLGDSKRDFGLGNTAYNPLFKSNNGGLDPLTQLGILEFVGVQTVWVTGRGSLGPGLHASG